MNQISMINETKYGDKRFEQLWSIYPKKIGKAYAFVCFRRLRPSDSIFSQMITALQNQIKYSWHTKQYVPNLSTWINQRRWEDEVEIPQETRPNDVIENKEKAEERMKRLLEGE